VGDELMGGPLARTHLGRQVRECLTSEVHAPRVSTPSVPASHVQR
jgi:hypothetical protein